MKKLLLILLSFCFIFVTDSQQSSQLENIFLDTFQLVGAKPEQFVLHHGGRIDFPIPKEQVETFINKIKRDLPITKVEKWVDRDGIKYKANALMERSLKLTLTVINDQPSRSTVKPYLSLQIAGQGIPNSKFARARTQLLYMLNHNNISPQLHFSLQGNILQQSSRLESPIGKVFQKLEAKEVESMRTKRTVSISAYSPLLGNNLLTRGGLMNIQAASRLNRETKQLIFTLGTPIITIEY